MNSHRLNNTPDRWQWTAARPAGISGWLGYAGLALAIVWVLHWSAEGAQMSWGELAGGMPQIGDFLSRSVPPDWSMLPRLWAPALETIQIAVWGTLLSVILALPLSFIAASNLHSWHWLRRITRQFLNVVRSVNELILALVFVSAVGLGPFPGVLALALHGMGMLGKFFAESIEEIDNGPLEALRSAGASQLQVIVFGVIPQAITAWIGVVLYRFNLSQVAFNYQLPLSERYLPSWMEIGISVFVVTLIITAYRFICTKMPVLYEHPDYKDAH